MTRIRRIKHWDLYLLLLPTVVYYALLEYVPMYGLQIAFKDFKVALGFAGSEWVGLKYFERFFDFYLFWDILKNTVLLSLYELSTFPIAVLMALLLNQLVSHKFKRIVQTVTYAPYFISTVVLAGMLNLFLSPGSGLVNRVITMLGGEAIYFFGDSSWFKSIFVWSGVWQNLGWGMVIYLAALTAISPELHEAAVMDGASKFRRIWHIDLPGIMPTVTIMLILSIGNMFNLGFEKAYLLQNPLNISSAEIIQTYVYKKGLVGGQFSYGAAIGFFNSVMNFILLIAVNSIARRMNQTSLW
ncbi:sugar ABC transporter permease [Cohnella sp. LGH]|uniref:ABC transporter permease n=1 Tax=Cohnella sp. LGH TaxID=1619153 RepID=UPI001ADCE026|nr:ABC transporter permease subunit [Cohnella sp. LGH]QTH41995.1 sugar ABC transporter permease [Cohnella sp. LGH]